jgi:hypothetical protein
MQRRIERALFHFEKILRGVFNDFGDGVPMSIATDKRPQDHHVECALEDFILRLTASADRSLHSDSYGKRS